MRDTKATLHADDGLRHLVKDAWNRGFNGWSYYFLCGADVAYMAKGSLTEEAPTCIPCSSMARTACR